MRCKCGVELVGAFCHACGEPNGHPLMELVKHLTTSVMRFRTRLHTVKTTDPTHPSIAEREETIERYEKWINLITDLVGEKCKEDD